MFSAITIQQYIIKKRRLLDAIANSISWLTVEGFDHQRTCEAAD